MRRILVTLTMLILAGTLTHAGAQFRIGGKEIKTDKLLRAGADVAKAITLTDAQVAELSREAVEWMDENNPIADETTPWGERLKNLTKGITEVDGIALNFKVYLVTDINAFATGDGSIRIFSSLMDIMDDDELMAIIGHEIGHIVNADVKESLKNAYLASAAKHTLQSTDSKVAELTQSQLGELVDAFTSAQFSQKQEYAADEYGFKFCVENGYSPYGMANSLNKLIETFNSEKSSFVAQMFSSHPDSEKRAEKMKTKADEYSATE